MDQKKYFIANWKMNCTPHAACELAQTYCDQSNALQTEQATIIICPSFDALAVCAHIVAQSPIKVGAQAVSPFPLGAHTGQIAAESLAEIGCTYAIIGHSERRQECHETSEQVASQVKELITHGITPIICIGETEQEFKTGNSKSILEAQLEPILRVLKTASKPKPIIIAYEPIFAIGTGIVPDSGYLKTIFEWLDTHLKNNLPDQACTLIYGGSVSNTTIKLFKSVTEIQGFLIGSASLDFQKFQKIVSLWYTK